MIQFEIMQKSPLSIFHTSVLPESSPGTDLSTLQKNYDALKDKLHPCHEDLINYASLLSNLQIKY